MAYFAPYVDETGIHIPTYKDIIEKRVNDIKAIYGHDIYLANDSADYQLLSVESLALFEAMQAIQYAYNQMSPVTAIGAGLSSLVQLNGIRRQPASYSTCDVVLTGTKAVTIVNGEVKDESGNTWTLPSPITLQASGSPTGEYYELIVTATCKTEGPIVAKPGDINAIATPTAGWTGVNNEVDASIGKAQETDMELRHRQSLSVESPSQTMLSGTIAAIAAVPNVKRFRVYENPTNSTTYGVPMVPFEGAPEHSITCIVEGGTIEDIANAIYYNRGIGCFVNGDPSTLVEIEDEYGVKTEISFFRPVEVDMYVEIEIEPLEGYLVGTIDLIKEKVTDYINGLGIGDILTISSIISVAMSVNKNLSKPSFSVISTLIGTGGSVDSVDITGDYDTVFVGSIDNIDVSDS